MPKTRARTRNEGRNAQGQAQTTERSGNTNRGRRNNSRRGAYSGRSAMANHGTERGLNPNQNLRPTENEFQRTCEPRRDQRAQGSTNMFQGAEVASTSGRSSSSKRKKQLEVDAAKRRYEVQKRLIEEKAQLELNLINQQLAADLAEHGDTEDEEDLRTIITRRTANRTTPRAQQISNVETWMNNEGMGHNNARQSHCLIPENQPNPITMRGTDVLPRREDTAQRILQRISVGKSLPTFDGDVLEWPCFKRAFNETTERGGYTEEENLIRLYDSLKGSAKEAVSSLMVTTRDTHQVMNLLELRFGNPNVIAARIVDDIKTLPKIFNSNGDLVLFATKVRNCVAALENANHIGYLHSPDLIKEITQKLPYAMIYNYNRYLHDNGTPNEPALVTLSKFIFHEAEIACRAGTLESLTPNTQRKRDIQLPGKDFNTKRRIDNQNSARKSTLRPPKKVYATTQRNEEASPEPKRSKKNQNCSYCKQQSHLIETCDQFNGLSILDRWNWARSKGICYKCLKDSSHRQMQCHEPTCNITSCGRNHHNLLHQFRSERTLNYNPSPSDLETQTENVVSHARDSEER